MKPFVFIVLGLISCDVYGQVGYVKPTQDSTITGYLRYYTSVTDGQRGLEVWKSKRDKNPLRIPVARIYEYAIKKDTFRVLHQYRPFPDEDMYYELIELKRKEQGKVNFYSIEIGTSSGHFIYHPNGSVTYVTTVPFQKPFPHPHIYILEHRATGYLQALPYDKEQLKEALTKFFPERFVTKYGEVNGEIKYKDIPKMVDLYNSK